MCPCSRTVGFNGSILAIASPRLSLFISLLASGSNVDRNLPRKSEVLLCYCQKIWVYHDNFLFSQGIPIFFFCGCFRAKKTHWGSTPHMCRSNRSGDWGTFRSSECRISSASITSRICCIWLCFLAFFWGATVGGMLDKFS